VDDDGAFALRVGDRERLENAIGPRRVVGTRHHRATVGLLDAGGDHLRIGGDHHLPEPRRLRAAHDVDDHRLPGNVEERLAWKARRRHARGDNNENVGHRSPSAGRHTRNGAARSHPEEGPTGPVSKGEDDPWVGRLYGLPGTRQTGYLCAAAIHGGLPVLPDPARAWRRWILSK